METGSALRKLRIRLYTEDKAKVVAVSWGIELLQFLAALAIFHQEILAILSPQGVATSFAFSSV